MAHDVVIEICCSDIHSVQLAEIYGADAIELCIDLEHGGLTPSIAMIQKARKLFSREMAVFFRPRNGDFIYDRLEKDIILKDINTSIDCGIDVIVAGGLDHEGNLDTEFMNEIVGISMGQTISYHRAIDISKNPTDILEQLIQFQIDRVLSSGCASKAFDGMHNLTRWNNQFGDKIQIMAGGGVDHTNAIELIQKTGLKRFHASLRSSISSKNNIMDLGCSEKADEQKIKLLMQAFNR